MKSLRLSGKLLCSFTGSDFGNNDMQCGCSVVIRLEDNSRYEASFTCNHFEEHKKTNILLTSLYSSLGFVEY